MPDVTYYFNSKSTSVWADSGYMIDNILTNYASTASDGAFETLDGNTCPGDDLGTITKVEGRAYGYGDADDQIIVYFRSNGAAYGILTFTPGISPVWSSYQALSTISWAEIVAMLAKVEFQAVSKGNTIYCAKVEIRVTYWSPPVADIDVGAIPIDRGSSFNFGWTFVAKDNPANASGTLQTIKIWANANLENLVVGTFYTTNGDTLKCRDSATIGAVEAGAERTFTEDEGSNPLAITVEEGDYIGCYFTAGNIEGSTTEYGGIWAVEGDYTDPNGEVEYTFAAGYAMSLYGYGDIEVPPEVGIENKSANMGSKMVVAGLI